MNFTFNDITATFSEEDRHSHKVINIFAYVPMLFFVPLIGAPKSPVAKFHANQGFILTGAIAATSFLAWILNHIMVWMTPTLAFVNFGLFGLVAYGITCAARDRAVEFPIVSSLRVFR